MRTIIAAYPDMDRARRALTALERSGIEAEDISLEGPSQARSMNEPVTRWRDAGVSRHVTTRAGVGLATGVVLGGIIGFLVGGALAGHLVAALAFAGAAAGALLGAVIGTMVGGLGFTAETKDWELTHDRWDGPVEIKVTSADDPAVDRAAAVLRSRGALRVDRT